MKIIFQGGFDRNSVALRTITQSGHTKPTPPGPSFRPKRPTALSWAAHWSNPLLYPPFHPATTASLPLHVSGFIRHRGRPKIYFKKEENFRRRKSVSQAPRF